MDFSKCEEKIMIPYAWKAGAEKKKLELARCQQPRLKFDIFCDVIFQSQEKPKREKFCRGAWGEKMRCFTIDLYAQRPCVCVC